MAPFSSESRCRKILDSWLAGIFLEASTRDLDALGNWRKNLWKVHKNNDYNNKAIKETESDLEKMQLNLSMKSCPFTYFNNDNDF